MSGIEITARNPNSLSKLKFQKPSDLLDRLSTAISTTTTTISSPRSSLHLFPEAAFGRKRHFHWTLFMSAHDVNSHSARQQFYPQFPHSPSLPAPEHISSWHFWQAIGILTRKKRTTPTGKSNGINDPPDWRVFKVCRNAVRLHVSTQSAWNYATMLCTLAHACRLGLIPVSPLLSSLTICHRTSCR